MEYDVIDRLVRPANPVPDPRVLETDVVSIIHERERREMQQQQVATERVKEDPRKGRGPWVGVAAATVLVIGGFLLFQATQPDDVAEATPLDIANEYLEAYAAFDVDRVASMLAEDAEVVPWEGFAGPRDWQSDLRFLEAAGFQLFVGECRELPPLGDAHRVSCDYEAHGLGSDEIGLGPFGGHVFRLAIEDGEVTSSDMGFNFSEFSQEMWWPFLAWIQENHSADFPVMYVSDTLSRQTEEAIALWEQRVVEYAAYVNGE